MCPDRTVEGNERYSLERFVEAQQGVYRSATEELREGRKRSHWMWFIFPQLRGLGFSRNADYYGIAGLDEARAYLDHAVLGERLLECVELVNAHGGRSAQEIFGPVDAMKLRSCATLFHLAGGPPPFGTCLQAFFGGEMDAGTVELLRAQT